MTVHKLWYTPIYIKHVGKILNSDSISYLMPDRTTIKTYNSVRPWSTEDNLHKNPVFFSFSKFILDQSSILLDELGILRKNHFISSMWLNAQFHNQNHLAHIHPNSVISGVYYVDCSKNSQSLVFWDPRYQSTVFQFRKNPEKDNSMVELEPKNETLIMWPSWLQHATRSRDNCSVDSIRISVSFNILIEDLIDLQGGKINLVNT